MNTSQTAQEINLQEYPNTNQLMAWWSEQTEYFKEINRTKLFETDDKFEDFLRKAQRSNRIDVICSKTKSATIFKETLQAKGIQFLVEYGVDTIWNCVNFGITYGKGVYHWFSVEEYHSDSTRTFIGCYQSYSTNNGVCERGLLWRLDKERNLAKKLGVTYLIEIFKSEAVENTIAIVLNDK